MSANAFLSKHTPGLSGGIVNMPAAGILTVATGLREVRSATANIKTQAIVADEEGIVVVDWGGTIEAGSILITVEKIGSASGSPADTAVDVAFTAIGDR